MKNPIIKFLSALLISFIGCVMLTPVVADAYQVSTLVAFENLALIDLGVNASVLVVYLVLQPDAPLHFGGAFAIQKEIWVDTLVQLLFKEKGWITSAFNEDRFVLAGKVVHVPRSTGSIEVVKNRTSVPATAVKRTREDVTYALDEYTTTPSLIPDADKIELSFDAIAEALREHVESLEEQVGDEMLYLWRATGAGQIIRTGGANVGAVGSQTGTRKKFMKEQIKEAKFKMNKANIAKEGRVILLPSEFLDQLMDDEDLKKRDSSMELDMKGGVITRLYGFDIMERSDVLMYDNTGTPVAKLPDALGAATDNIAALAWQKDCVTRAKGEVKLFDDTDNPLYYGDLYSALVRMGGRVRRDAGVFSIVQAVGV